MSSLPAEVQQLVMDNFEIYAPDALNRVRINAHMHNAKQTDSLDQDSADALLIGFINDACIPLDLALYADDLQPS